MAHKFSMDEHIRKHTRKENTYNPNCEFCNPELRTEDVIIKLKEWGYT